jgi:hypothetical protein
MIQFHYSTLLMFFIIVCINGYADVYNVKDFGATGLKEDNARQAIQTTIEACAETGGGTVFIPPGDYTTGTLVLKSNITLHLAGGATIWGSQDEKDYQTDFRIYKNNRSGDPTEGLSKALIYAKVANNISITGKGTIHGQAQREFAPLREVDGFISEETENARNAGVPMERWYKVEPFTTMIFLEECEDVTVRDVRLVESSEWTLHFKWCNRVNISGIYLFSSLESGVNADGIDIDGCSNVTVSDCIIETGDDAIVLKTTATFGESRPCENIVVTNCILTSTSTALKLGTESHADFRYISFSNCIVRDSNRGLSIVIRDGATAEHISFSNIQIECKRKPFFWWGNGDPIWLVVKKRYPDSKVGHIRAVRFENIVAVGQGTSKIEGYPGFPIEDVELRNVSLTLTPEGLPDKRANDILMVQETKHLRLQDVTLLWESERSIEQEWRHALTLRGVEGLDIKDLDGLNTPSSSSKDAIFAHNVRDARIVGVFPKKSAKTLFIFTGEKTSGIRLQQIDPESICFKKLEVAPEIKVEILDLDQK